MSSEPPTTGSTIQSRSDVDALLTTYRLNRDDQLCCFVADMQAIRRQGLPNHAPVMLTRTQAEAIEDFLSEHGFSVFGKLNKAA